MQAKIVETYKWSRSARIRGLTVEGIPGMFTVDLADFEPSLDRALAQWRDNTEVHYKDVVIAKDENGNIRFNGKRTHTTYNRAFTFNTEEMKQAIREALQGHM